MSSWLTAKQITIMQHSNILHINQNTAHHFFSCNKSMAYLQKKLLSSWFIIFSHMMMINFMLLVSARRIEHYTPPNITRLAGRFNHLSYNHGFTEVYGGSNIQQIKNGSSVNLTLKKTSGSGLVSQNKYNYGFFSAAIKLPPGYTSGVVVAFYLSNGNIFPHNHDEIDIELLGHESRKDWVLQTNIYGNGSVKTGREEKFYLWFDPTQDFHQYSIIWNSQHIVFLVDDIPVRQAPNTAAFYPVYPSKPMSVYATIWDGSEWATRGGKYPVNYKYAPFVASFGDMVMEGCKLEDSKDSARACAKSSLSGLDPVGGQEFTSLSKQQSTAMDWARKKLMFYSYCKDSSRFKSMPPECKT